LVAYELACRQSRAGGIQPVALFVSGAAAPHLGRAGRRISQLPDDALLADVSAFGGIPDELLADREAMAPYLPTLRADFEVFESYQHRARARLDQPTYLFGGERDHCVSSARLSAWREVTTVASVELFSGGHFYLQEHRRALTASIGTVLVQHLTRSTAA
jgi:surfactin synthase thioesterase subunit